MPSFDVTSEVNWQEIDNASQTALKEVSHRFDFKGMTCEIEVNPKEKKISLWCSTVDKLESLNDVFQTKLVKRGVSLLSLDYQKEIDASRGSGRRHILVQAGISKDKGKEIIKAIKDGKFKAQAQIQDEQVRVTAKSRDQLQEVIQFLKSKQDLLQIPMQFGNFRD